MFCRKCGATIESYANNCPFCGEPLANNNVQATYGPTQAPVTSEHRSIGKWVLTYILSCIPIVGIVMLIIWATSSKTKNDPTFRNWAKAQLLIMIIVFAVVFTFSFIIGFLAALL